MVDRKRAVLEKLAGWTLTVVIVGLMAALGAAVGFGLFGWWSMLLGVIVGGFMLAATPRITPKSLFSSRKIVPIESGTAPVLQEILQKLSRKAGLSAVPRLGYSPSSSMNAVTAGDKRDSVIVLTAGLLKSLSYRELAAVIGHELSHLRNGDIGLLALANAFRRGTVFLSRIGLVLLVVNLPLFLFTQASLPFSFIALMLSAPMLSMVLHLALSRRREFAADLGAAELTGDPEALASALRRISNRPVGLWSRYIAVPQESTRILQTHPDTEERIRRLKDLSGIKIHRPFGFVPS